MRYPKKYTQKEWEKFPMHVQELLCKRYNVTLTDWQNKKQKVFKWIKNNLTPKNLDKGIDTFNKGVQEFGNMMDDMTKELGGSNKGKPNLWSNSKTNNIDILMGKKPVQKRKGKKKKMPSKDEINLKRIWGERNEKKQA